MSVIQEQRLGEVRPSQIIFSYGVGALIDLPNFSVIVNGLDDWPIKDGSDRIIEERLLRAVQNQLGAQVRTLLLPPTNRQDTTSSPFDPQMRIGVPVALFPRWLYCPACRWLAPWSDGQFDIDEKPFHPERTRIIHKHCSKAKRPQVVPARFMVACASGHLDDFPWVEFAHRGGPICNAPNLYLTESYPTGEARDIWVECKGADCPQNGRWRPLAEAFGARGKQALPMCRGRRPHLRDFDLRPCPNNIETILLGASNLWFGDVLTALAIPGQAGRIDQLVEDNWNLFESMLNEAIFAYERNKYKDSFRAFAGTSDPEIWAAVERKKERDSQGRSDDPSDLKSPEWRQFSNPHQSIPSRDFQLSVEPVPTDYNAQLEQVVLAERLREVRALIGFTRIDAPGDLESIPPTAQTQRMVLARTAPTWVPAAEVRGEGIFIQFREQAIQEWLIQLVVRQREGEFGNSHYQWRQQRHITPPDVGFPGMRYVLLHTVAHALMRQLSLECGYTAAGLRERVYARDPNTDPNTPDPMAGFLLYTAAPDSEGTLGGLVALGKQPMLKRLLNAALHDAAFCTSDPLCAEHAPDRQGIVVHGSACHACLFAPETSCECGNRYLDRAVLVPTVTQSQIAFFAIPT